MVDRDTVVVIGGGLAGLAAARRLSLAGRTVRLYEANGKLGGCCATTDVAGYVLNDGALFLALPAMLDRLFERLGLDRAALLPLRRILALQRTVLPDGMVVTFAEDPDVAFEGSDAASAAPRARQELRTFLARWDPLLHLFADDLLLRPLSLSHLIARGWRHLPLLRGTVARHLRAGFSHEAMRAALSGALLYAGVAPGKLPAAALVGLAAMFRHGHFIPEGGMGRIAAVLGDAVRRAGGNVLLNAAAERIVVKGGRVRGVEVAGEGFVQAGAVVSTVSAMHTFATLMSGRDVPARTARKVRRAKLSHRGFVLQLGLANRIDVPCYGNSVLPFLAQQDEFFRPDERRLRWPVFMVPTVAIPELAPPGASIVEVFPTIPQGLPPEAWTEERKEELAARTIDRLQGLHRMEIAVRRIVSPREFQAGMHLYSGALYGLSPAAGPGDLFGHRCPVPGLYQAGQTTWPGFGVASAGLSGVMAADRLLRDDGG